MKGAHGWPLAPSQRFPGELTLACPACGSLDVTLGTRYPVHGTGPLGRGRLGDPGATEYSSCAVCGQRSESRPA